MTSRALGDNVDVNLEAFQTSDANVENIDQRAPAAENSSTKKPRAAASIRETARVCLIAASILKSF
jgi:hypothetical protein